MIRENFFTFIVYNNEELGDLFSELEDSGYTGPNGIPITQTTLRIGPNQTFYITIYMLSKMVRYMNHNSKELYEFGYIYPRYKKGLFESYCLFEDNCYCFRIRYLDKQEYYQYVSKVSSLGYRISNVLEVQEYNLLDEAELVLLLNQKESECHFFIIENRSSYRISEVNELSSVDDLDKYALFKKSNSRVDSPFFTIGMNGSLSSE